MAFFHLIGSENTKFRDGFIVSRMSKNDCSVTFFYLKIIMLLVLVCLAALQEKLSILGNMLIRFLVRRSIVCLCVKKEKQSGVSLTTKDG